MHLVVYPNPPPPTPSPKTQTTKLVVWGKLPRKGNIESGRHFLRPAVKHFLVFVLVIDLHIVYLLPNYQFKQPGPRSGTHLFGPCSVARSTLRLHAGYFFPQIGPVLSGLFIYILKTRSKYYPMKK